MLPLTIDSYYTTKVHHDMANFLGGASMKKIRLQKVQTALKTAF